MRLGGVMVSPLIQMVNFVAIMFLYVRHLISFEVFAPIFVILGFVLLSYIGVRFRKHQASTDYNMVFEKQTQQAKIFYEIMRAIKSGKTDEEFDKIVKYVKDVSENKI